MRKEKLTTLKKTAAGEAGRVESAVTAILRKLKRGERVKLPGLGSFVPGAPPRFEFEKKRDAQPGPRWKANRDAGR